MGSGPLNTNLEPGPVNSYSGPGPVNTRARARAGGQAKYQGPGNTNTLTLLNV